MSDEARRRCARGAATTAEAVVAHAQEEAAGRGVCSLREELGLLVGQWIYVEAVPLNYRGMLDGVCFDAMGEPTALIGRWIRTGDWNEVPNVNYDQAFERGVLFLRSVSHVAPMPAAWPRTGP